MDLCFGIEIRAPDEFDGLDATKKLAILVTKLLVASRLGTFGRCSEAALTGVRLASRRHASPFI